MLLLAGDPKMDPSETAKQKSGRRARVALRVALWTAAVTLLLAVLVAGAGWWREVRLLPAPVRGEILVAGVVGLAVFATLTTLAVAWAVRRLLQRPLEDLSRALDAAADGDFLIRMREHRADELGDLARGFNRLLVKITDLQVDKIDADRELAGARREVALTEELSRRSKIIEEQSGALGARVEELEMLLEITEKVAAAASLDDLLRALVDRAGRTLGFPEAAILLKDPSSGRFVVRATHGFDDAAAIVGMAFAADEGISGQVATTGEAVIIDDTSADARYLHYKGRHPVDGAFLCNPIRHRGQLLGLFHVLRPGGQAFSDRDLRLLNSLALHAGIAISHAQLEERIAALPPR